MSNSTNEWSTETVVGLSVGGTVLVLAFLGFLAGYYCWKRRFGMF
jgi:hypothetical protein